MKWKFEWWHLCFALIVAVIGAVIGTVIQILLVNYGVFDHVGSHQSTTLNGSAGFTESHDFTFTNDTTCAPNAEPTTRAYLDKKCSMNGYVAYAAAECSAFSGRPGHDLFLRCIR